MGYVMQHRMHELSRDHLPGIGLRNGTLVESLTGIETIKTQGAEA